MHQKVRSFASMLSICKGQNFPNSHSGKKRLYRDALYSWKTIATNIAHTVYVMILLVTIGMDKNAWKQILIITSQVWGRRISQLCSKNTDTVTAATAYWRGSTPQCSYLGRREGVTQIHYAFGGIGSSCLMSDFNFTNSLATSSLLLCERMRNIVHPVSSMLQRFPRESHRAQEACKQKIFIHTWSFY